ALEVLRGQCREQLLKALQSLPCAAIRKPRRLDDGEVVADAGSTRFPIAAEHRRVETRPQVKVFAGSSGRHVIFLVAARDPTAPDSTRMIVAPRFRATAATRAAVQRKCGSG